MHCVHKNAKCGPEKANFRTKTLHFLRVIRLNWLAKIELRGTRRSWSSILLISYTVVSENAKKKLKLKKQSAFLSHFCHWWNFNWGGLPLLPLHTPMLLVRKTKKVFANFPPDFCRFPTKFQLSSNEISTVFQRNFNLSKSGSNQKGEEQRFKGIFRPKSEFQAVFPAENRWSPKKKKKKGLHPKNVMKFGVSPQKSLYWASICTPVAPSLLISSGHSPRLGGHKQSFGGARPRYAHRGAGSASINQSYLFCHKIKTIIHEICYYVFKWNRLGGLRSDLPVFESSSHLTFVGQ